VIFWFPAFASQLQLAHRYSEDFLQEGHRLEFAKMEDSTSELTVKGVVFNEMKGAMGSQSARFSRALGATVGLYKL
jgi:Zn-dependent M16 (insulinase) family peptidase